MSDQIVWPRDALARGTELNGYHIEAVIGRGGFGITYRALDGIDQLFAIKEYFPKQFASRHGHEVLASDQESLEPFRECLNRFGQEARALRQLAAHGAAGDGVVKVATFFQANGTAYTVMEFVDGSSLDQVIARRPTGLAPDTLATLVPRLVHAIACVHAAGLLHRDIKPGNIILRPDGRPVLIDFGAARVATQGRTRTFTQIFSEGYAPIEQFSGTHQGPFSDIYALGSTFYRAIGGTTVDSFTRHQALLRGKPDPQPPAAKVGAGRYDPRLLAAIDAAVSVSPEDRPQTVAELLQLLQPDVAEAPTATAPRPKPAPPPSADTIFQRPAPDAAPPPPSAPRAPLTMQPGKPRRGQILVLAGALLLACGLPAAYLIWRQAHPVDWTTSLSPPVSAASAITPANPRSPNDPHASAAPAPEPPKTAEPPAPEETTALAKATQSQTVRTDTAAQGQAEQARDKLNDLIFAATAKFEELGVPHDGFPTSARQVRDNAVDAFNQQDWPDAVDRFAAAYPIVTADIRNRLGLSAAQAVQQCHQDLTARKYDDAQSHLDRAKLLKKALDLWPSPDQHPDGIDNLLTAQDRAYQRQSNATKLFGSLGLASASSGFLEEANVSLKAADQAVASGDTTAAEAAYARAADRIDSGVREALSSQKEAFTDASKRDLGAGRLAKAQSDLDKAKAIQHALDQVSAP